jgi:Domain of Unknown Function (DUF1080)
MSNCPICRWLCVAIMATFAPLALAEETPIKVVDTPPGKAPSDAVVLYDGSSTEAFVGVDGKPCTWQSKDGIMTVGKGFIVSKLHFRDAQLHVEFMVPTEQAGNSGVYIHKTNQPATTPRNVPMMADKPRFAVW